MGRVNVALCAFTVSGDGVNTDWKTKSVRQWGSDDILWWIISVANGNALKTEEIDVSHFNGMDGTTLYKMSEADFVSRESQHGRLLYHVFQQLKQEEDRRMAYNINKCEFFSPL